MSDHWNCHSFGNYKSLSIMKSLGFLSMVVAFATISQAFLIKVDKEKLSNFFQDKTLVNQNYPDK